MLGIIIETKFFYKILPIKNGFIFLKTKFTLTENGKVLRKVNRQSLKRLNKKLNSQIKWVEEGTFSEREVLNTYASWRGHVMRCNSYNLLKKTDKLVHKKLQGVRKFNKNKS